MDQQVRDGGQNVVLAMNAFEVTSQMTRLINTRETAFAGR
jgi:hypothetical protein